MRAKKSYGQHFLRNEKIALQIAQGFSSTYPCVLEIGPGKGMLTKYLLEQSWDLKVVEADPDMVEYLTRHFSALDGKIIGNDFLKLRLEDLFDGNEFGIIGNFPYNISSQILFKMLYGRAVVPELVGMFQKEVAERVVCPPGSKEYGVISVLVQAYYEGEYLFTVDKAQFNPPPKVQSGVIRLKRKENQDLGCDDKLFRRVVKQAFSQRRKMLRNTLKPFFPDETLKLESFFEQRPERLSVADYVQLTQRIDREGFFDKEAEVPTN